MDPRAFLILPIFGIMFLAFASEMADIAQSTSDKTLDFAGDMENAVDCAVRGLPLEQCSPGIMGYDFTQDMNETMNKTQNFVQRVLERAEFDDPEYDYEVHKQGDKTILIISEK